MIKVVMQPGEDEKWSVVILGVPGAEKGLFVAGGLTHATASRLHARIETALAVYGRPLPPPSDARVSTVWQRLEGRSKPAPRRRAKLK